MRLEAGLQARQEMQMKLAPQVIQSIEILQLPLIELQKRIDRELEENPLLESSPADDAGTEGETEESPDSSAEGDHSKTEPDDISPEDAKEAVQFERLEELTDYYQQHSSDEPKNSRTGIEVSDARQQALENSPGPEPSLQDHLTAQLAYISPPPPLSSVCRNIIANLDDRGYLASPLEDILDSVDETCSMKIGEEALRIVQGLEPPGVGARDLKECLLLQLDPRRHDYELTARLIRNHFEDIMKNRLPKVAEDTGHDIESIKEALHHIGELNPRPGSLFLNPAAPHIMPDVTIRDNDGNYEVVIENSWLPSLRVSAYYANRLQQKDLDAKTRQYLAAKLQAAQGIISAIEQRRATLQSVTEEIIKAQKDFFDRGRMHLKPLKMQDVADAIGVHVSTVSRSIANKYVQTPQGLYSLKRFFTGGTRKVDGDMESWDVVRSKLIRIVENEDKKKPLSDEAIAEHLRKQGIDIARRTVAKYRKLLNIPSSRMRREF